MKIVAVLARTKLASRMSLCCYAYARVVARWLLGGNKSKKPTSNLSNPSLIILLLYAELEIIYEQVIDHLSSIYSTI